MPKESLKDKLEGNDLDLSLGNLTAVPVKELAALPKATHLDLSCNLISTIPENFCSLKHLVKIDLSKNSISELPHNFGELSNLQHLDLLGNKLQVLPITFWQLRKLKWLDLKDNPLEEGLKHAAGDCLDDIQCRKCSQQVLTYMKAINSDIERKKQKRLQEEREMEAEKKEEEERERQKKKAEKLAEKDRRRLEYEARRKQTVQDEDEDEEEVQDESAARRVHNKQVPKSKENKGISWCFAFFNILLAVCAVCVGLYIYCDMKKIIPQCHEVVTIGDNIIRHVKSTVHHYMDLVSGKKS